MGDRNRQGADADADTDPRGLRSRRLEWLVRA
jgi:hypothetical protein